MLTIGYQKDFLKTLSKIRHQGIKEKMRAQIEKIIENPEIGKPMRYSRKGTRELYVAPYRLSYAYFEKGNKIVFPGIYHKDGQ